MRGKQWDRLCGGQIEVRSVDAGYPPPEVQYFLMCQFYYSSAFSMN